MKLKTTFGALVILLSSIAPAMAVDDGSNFFYTSQSVGIKKRAPLADLHVNGTALFEDGNVVFSNTSPITINGLALVNNTLQIPSGASTGYILRSDATGVASWVDPSTIGSNECEKSTSPISP